VPYLLKDNQAVSNVISTVILTSVLIIITIASSFFANQTLTTNIENVQFDQAINTVLSVEKIARNMMFEPYATASVSTSFSTTDPYIVESGNLTVLINGVKQVSFLANYFKILGGPNVGVPFIKDYVGNNSLMLIGFGGTISHIHTYQSNGAWVSLDYDRIRCVYSGVAQFHNDTGFGLYNVVEITIVKLIAGELTEFERSRVIIENTGIETNQLEYTGNPTIKIQLSGIGDFSVNLSELGGNIDYPTLINLAVVCLKISVLGGG